MPTDERQPIRLLDDVTASRIAAGEVVERPASVVKELVENSLDAGAGTVRVEMEAGGRRLIRVIDDGRGIPAADVELALARHATSKLRSADDLDHVRTLGFRGEALAAIASVSHLTLLTRTADALEGVEVRVTNGRLEGRRPLGAAVGTRVTVENLFHAQPARLRFLRTDQTEAGHVTLLVMRYALAHRNTRFELVRDGRTVFRSTGSGDPTDALAAAFGLDVARELIPLRAPPTIRLAAEDAPSGPRVGGYVGPPHLHRATRRDISIFVNGRPVTDGALVHAVVQAYHTLLPGGRYPVALVMIGLPPAQVDVNVHPAKTEVRFRDARGVFAAVQRAVRAAVTSGAHVPGIREARAWPPPAGHESAPDAQPGLLASDGAPAAGGEWGAGTAAACGPPADRLPPLRVLGQVGLAFIVAEGPDGLYLVDQHAAHERIVYEDLMARPAERPSQRLLVPEAVRLAPDLAGLAAEHAALLAAVGFDMEPFGPDTVLVRAVPEVLARSDAAAAVRDVLALAQVGRSGAGEAMEERLVRAVCKRATVKAGQALEPDEMRALVRRLETCAAPRTCPHGRPTVTVLTLRDIGRALGRG